MELRSRADLLRGTAVNARPAAGGLDLHLERSIAEYSALFDKAGLRRIKTTPPDNGFIVIETAAT
jgi:hypothetical protein